MLTAAQVAAVAAAEDGGVRVEATVGPDAARLGGRTGEPSASTRARDAAPGTINIVAFLPVRHSDAALANLLCTVTEAKVQALFEAGVAARAPRRTP